MKRSRLSSVYSCVNCYPKSRSRKLGIRPISSTSKPSITAYGKGIDASGLFPYTNGRWLFNEKKQLADRYVRFDVDELCRRAASIFGDATRCTNIDKIEGGSNKALLLTMDDGNEVFAKIPCPNAGPSHYTTASEAATLEFVRSHTSILVPRVMGWNSDPANPVGTEYIFLEKMQGVRLADKWNSMKPFEKFKLIDRIINAEAELTKIQFPAYGSLYFQDSIPDDSMRIPLTGDVDSSGTYCIGPPCDGAWSHVALSEGSSKSRGPWASLEDFALASIQRMRTSPKNKEKSEEYNKLVESLTRLIQTIAYHPDVISLSKPVLWHSDSHAGNIFVSPENPSSLLGIIDWQSTVIGPLFLQSHFPVFLKPPKHYTPGYHIHELPENFDQLNEYDKQLALRDKQLATDCKAYEMNILNKNKEAHNALGLNRNLWDPFYQCSRYSPSTASSLRDRLINVSENWSTLRMPTECPFTLDYDLEKHREEMETESEYSQLQELVETYTGARDDGFVFPDQWEEADAANQELLEKFIEAMAEEGKSKEEATSMWPFRDKE